MIQKVNGNERYNKGQHPMVTSGLLAPRIFESGTDHDTTADLHNNWVELVNPTPLENVQDIESTLITHPEMAIDDTLQLEEDHVARVDTNNFPTTIPLLRLSRSGMLHTESLTTKSHATLF